MGHKRRSPRTKTDGYYARCKAFIEIALLFTENDPIATNPQAFGQRAMKTAAKYGCSREFGKLARIAWRQAAVRRTSASATT